MNKLAIITPIKACHEEVYQQCRESIDDAWSYNKGPFKNIEIIAIDNIKAEFGRSKARNKGIEQAKNKGCNWIFFLDADDLMVKEAFENISTYLDDYDAVWGLICFKEFGGKESIPRIPQAITLKSLDELLLLAHPDTTLQISHFIKTDIAANILFDEEMNIGEEFKYYIKLWESHECIKVPELFSLRSNTGDLDKLSSHKKELVACVVNQFREKREEVGLCIQDIETISLINSKTVECQEYSIENKLYETYPYKQCTYLSYNGFINTKSLSNKTIMLFHNNDDTVCKSLGWTGSYEATSTHLWQKLISFYPENTKKIILDIGAYNGYYGILAAVESPDSDVFCFEPMPENYARCLLNANNNSLNNLTIINAAVFNQQGVTKLHSFAEKSFLTTGASLNPNHKGEPVSSVVTQALKLDNVFNVDDYNSIKLMKIDVEGVEYEALQGAENIIKTSRPDLLIEITVDNNLSKINLFLESLGYEFYSVLEDKQTLRKEDKLKVFTGLTDINRLATCKPESEVINILADDIKLAA